MLARGEDNIQDQVCRSMVICGTYLQRQLQHYLNLRKAVDNFRNHAKDQIDRLDGGAKDDLQRKFSGLLTFDYEAAARLKAWGSFNAILDVRSHYARLKQILRTSIYRNVKYMQSRRYTSSWPTLLCPPKPQVTVSYHWWTSIRINMISSRDRHSPANYQRHLATRWQQYRQASSMDSMPIHSSPNLQCRHRRAAS